MANKKNKQRPGRSYYKLFLQATALAWGFVPGAKASIKDLKMFIKRCLINIARNDGRWEMDPEVPDDFLSLIIPALVSRNVPYNDVEQVLNVAMGIDPSGGTAGMYVGPDGSMITVADTAATGDGWAQNTAEWWNATWAGDWETGWTNFQQGWNDFWAGNF